MGLDSVVLLMDIEKHFDISISDQEAENIYTVQDFADCVYKHMTIKASDKCFSQILFYRLRNMLVDILDIDKNRIKLDSRLDELIPSDNKEQIWGKIVSDLNLRAPELNNNYNKFTRKESRFLFITYSKRSLSLEKTTMKDLINWLLALNHEKLLPIERICSRSDIERIVIGIVHQSCGIPINEIELGQSITYDLGID